MDPVSHSYIFTVPSEKYLRFIFEYLIAKQYKVVRISKEGGVIKADMHKHDHTLKLTTVHL